MKLDAGRMALKFFVLSSLLLVFGVGLVVGRFQIFPYGVIRDGIVALTALTRAEELPWYYRETAQTRRVDVHRPDAAHAGLNLITTIADDHHLSVQIVAMDGTLVHAWDVDWFDIWPDAGHLTEDERPAEPPGTNVHGAAVLPNGDLVFNYLDKGLVRLDPCGNVVWRLPYRTHHSVDVDGRGHIWVPGFIPRREPVPGLPNHEPPFREFTLLEVSPDGEILRELSIMTLLQRNGLSGLLYMSSTANLSTAVTGDTLHMNDAETFPQSLEPGFFRPGDIMVSLRNINTVLVFDRDTEAVRYVNTGRVVRQHDPDFVDGDTISVFDNNHVAPESESPQSRIVRFFADDRAPEVAFRGTEERPFYTDIMGKHQWLPNGNLLVTEARSGRAFELTPDGELAWQYYNLVAPGKLAWMEEVERLPLSYGADIENALAEGCRLR